MARVEGGCIVEAVDSLQYGSDFARGALQDPARWINRSCDACVRGAQKPSCIFYCAHSCLLQMLRVGAAIAIPAVVRDVHENLRAIFRKLPNFIRKYKFIADEDPSSFIACLERI